MLFFLQYAWKNRWSNFANFSRPKKTNVATSSLVTLLQSSYYKILYNRSNRFLSWSIISKTKYASVLYLRKFTKMQFQSKSEILHKFASLLFSKVIVLKAACSEPFQERNFLGNLKIFRRLLFLSCCFWNWS